MDLLQKGSFTLNYRTREVFGEVENLTFSTPFETTPGHHRRHGTPAKTFARCRRHGRPGSHVVRSRIIPAGSGLGMEKERRSGRSSAKSASPTFTLAKKVLAQAIS
jgi:hypothetical protein